MLVRQDLHFQLLPNGRYFLLSPRIIWRLRGRRGFTQQPENSKRAHLSAPALQTPPKFHEKTPREREREKKSENGSGRGKKSANFFGRPPFGAPPFGAPPFGAPPFRSQIFSGFGPHPLGPTMTPTHPDPNGLGKNGLAKVGQTWIGQNFGQNWSLPFEQPGESRIWIQTMFHPASGN